MIYQNANTLNSARNTVAQPILWVADTLEVASFPGFNLRQHSELKQVSVDSNDNHYILCDEDTPELFIKSVVWKYGVDRCFVHNVNYPLENLLSSGIQAKAKLGIQIIEFALPALDWIKHQNVKPLEIIEGKELSKLAFALMQDEEERSTEVAMLGRRCKCNDFTWNKYMENLEHRFKEELEKRNRTQSDDIYLESKIKEMIQETNIYKKEKIRDELNKKRHGNKKIDNLINYELSKQDNELIILSASEFRSTTNLGVDYLIPSIGIPAVGTSLVGGSSGIGKTRWAYDYAGCVMNDEEFLEEKPNNTSHVLFVNSPSEMLGCEIAEYFFDRGILGNENYSIIPNFNMHKIEQLKEKIKKDFPNLKLIIFDSLIGILKSTNPNLDENSAEAGLVVAQIKQFSEELKLASILLHHTCKDREAKGVNKFRGHGSIVGNANAALLLSGKENSNIRELTNVKCRGSKVSNIYSR